MAGRPWGLLVAAAAAAFAVLLLANACHTAPKSASKGSRYGTDLLAISLQTLAHVPEVSYSLADEHFVIHPADVNDDLVVVKLGVTNRAAIQVHLEVTPYAVALRDRHSPNADYKPVDPFEQREQVAAGNPGEDEYAPFIWGNIQLDYKCKDANGKVQACSIDGWLVFETPKDAQLNQLEWNTGDTVFVNF